MAISGIHLLINPDGVDKVRLALFLWHLAFNVNCFSNFERWLCNYSTIQKLQNYKPTNYKIMLTNYGDCLSTAFHNWHSSKSPTLIALRAQSLALGALFPVWLLCNIKSESESEWRIFIFIFIYNANNNNNATKPAKCRDIVRASRIWLSLRISREQRCWNAFKWLHCICTLHSSLTHSLAPFYYCLFFFLLIRLFACCACVPRPPLAKYDYCCSYTQIRSRLLSMGLAELCLTAAISNSLEPCTPHIRLDNKAQLREQTQLAADPSHATCSTWFSAWVEPVDVH